MKVRDQFNRTFQREQLRHQQSHHSQLDRIESLKPSQRFVSQEHVLYGPSSSFQKNKQCS